jgi:hypothetical protein
MSKQALGIVLLLVLLVGCGGKKPAGAECAAASECESGLDCFDFAQINGGTCTVIARMCTKSCTKPADCSSLGALFTCFATCTPGQLVCGETH